MKHDILTYNNNRLNMADEWNTEAICHQIIENDPCMVRAKYAGSGKIYEHFQKLNYNVLVVVETGPCKFRRSRCGFARIPLRFDAPAVVSREFAFRCSRCGFARIPASRGLFRPLLGGPLRLPAATARAVRRGLGFDAPAVVSHEFRCVSTLPLWFRANAVVFQCSREFRPLVASSGLYCLTFSCIWLSKKRHGPIQAESE